MIRRSMVKYVQIAIIISLISLSLFLLVGAYWIREIGMKSKDLIVTLNATGLELKATAEESRGDFKALGDYAVFQTEELRSDRNQKAIQHYLKVGETATLLLQRIARTTVPALNNTLNESSQTVASIRKPLARLDTLIEIPMWLLIKNSSLELVKF